MTVPLTLIVKTSSTCNMACKYCDADIYSNESMSFETLACMVNSALDTGRNVEFIWHGGEPLLLGKDFYQKVVWLQQKCLQNGQHVLNCIQTNGTLLTDEWLDFFCLHGFEIGLSIDGPPVLQDKNRVMQNQKGSFGLVLNALSLLRSRKIDFGVLAVVTEDTIRFGAKKFFNFFVENGLKNFDILCRRPAIIMGAEEYTPRSNHSQFVKEIFDLWYYLDDPEIHIREFESIMSALLGGGHTSCILAGGCLGKYFAVDPKGEVYHCDEFMNDPKYRLGNIARENFKDFISGPQIENLKEENKCQIQKLDCKWFPICNGGCPKDRYLARIFAEERGIQCCGFADLIEHIHARLIENPDVARLEVLRKLH
jgi:serine-type anaerobic sulfatase-maturating enzyme